MGVSCRGRRLAGFGAVRSNCCALPEQIDDGAGSELIREQRRLAEDSRVVDQPQM